MTEREVPAKLQDQPDTLAMIEAAFGNTRDILMNGTTNRYLSDHIEELIAARVAAARQQMAEEAIDLVAFHGGSVEIEAAIRSLTTTGDKA